VRRIIIILYIIVAPVSIYSLFGCATMQIVRRVEAGPDAVSLWKYRKYPYKTIQASRKYEKELQSRVGTYLINHPEIDRYIVMKLKGLSDVIEGMNKEQVELLYGRPDKSISDYKGLKYNSTEKWIYFWNPGEFRIFFIDNMVVAIEDKHHEPILP